MKYIKTYKIFETNASFMYDPSWEGVLPTHIKVIKGDPRNPEILSFKKGISRHLGPEVQIPYETDNHNGGRQDPDTLEFDIYWSFDVNTKSLNINVEVNYGDLTACQFSIEAPNKVDVIRYTSYHSKDDKSNTVFALDDESLQGFCNFINKWDHGIQIKMDDMKFLDQYDDYSPN